MDRGASCIGYIFRLGAFAGVGEPEGDSIGLWIVWGTERV